MLKTKLTKSILKTTDKYIIALEKAGVKTVGDLLYHFPREYDDRTNVLDNFWLINIKQKNTILVKLISINSTKTANKKLLTKAILEDKNDFISEAIWFNRKYFASTIQKYIWKKVLISWKIKYAFWKITFNSPELETDLSKISWEIVSLYSEINYIPNKWISTKIKLLKSYIFNFTEKLPENIIKKYSFIPKNEAIYKIHFPKNNNDIYLAKQRLVYEELFEINYKNISKKYENITKSKWKAISIKMNIDFIKQIISNLDFSLTNHQKISLFQILKDIEKSHSMSRLLQWDVWTWKTIVALIVGIYCIKLFPSLQVVFMVPTEILAHQHFNYNQELLSQFDIRSDLLVWSVIKKQKEIIKNNLKNWNINIIFWTHALVQEDVLFKNLWFVIIDEQHRFWVKQREILENGLWNISWIMPHVLNMTATPIPRTLTLIINWDQDLSIINEYPKWRKNIYTKVVKNQKQRTEVENFIRYEIQKGRQIFWISPLIEESEKMDLANAINIFENLQVLFKEFNVWLLHWKMKAKEKKQIMQDFKENKIQILSSTSVIEVWVDIPNATIICIEAAERFGLSQLHQFRWRVWRWQYQSYCYLFPTKWYKTDRLKAIQNTNNWFDLSEIDLQIRWPWEVYGFKQSWIPDLKIADLKDIKLISKIREDIEEMFEEDF